MTFYGYVFAIIACVVAVKLVHRFLIQRRRQALASQAARLGLDFRPDPNRDLPAQFGFLDQLAKGSNRYAFNVLTGGYEQCQVAIFDFHYETHVAGAGTKQNIHHYFLSVFILILPMHFPELRILPEGGAVPDCPGPGV